MIIIGEKINSTLKAVRPAIESYDHDTIQSLAMRQSEVGASYIDVNAGMFIDDEPERLEWLVNTVQAVTNVPLSVDSPSPVALEKALKANKNGKALVNSISDETAKFNAVAPLLTEYNASVIALCIDDQGMADTVDDKLRITASLVNKLTKIGLALGDIFIDPLVKSIGTGAKHGIIAIETIRKIKTEYPEIHIACGLSNISYGIPARHLMNKTFLVAAMTAGMDGAILDPLDKKLMASLYAADALLGQDPYCKQYNKSFKNGLFENV